MMKKADYINHWLRSSDHDLEVAETLYENEKYDYCLFLGHLALEKMLKALYIQNTDNLIPPKIHNLVKLADLALIDLSVEIEQDFLKINQFQLSTRYPDYQFAFYKTCTQDFSAKNLNRIKDLLQWLKSQIH